MPRGRGTTRGCARARLNGTRAAVTAARALTTVTAPATIARTLRHLGDAAGGRCRRTRRPQCRGMSGACAGRLIPAKDQLFVDVERGRFVSATGAENTYKNQLFDLAGALREPALRPHLEVIARTHPVQRLRKTAQRTLDQGRAFRC